MDLEQAAGFLRLGYEAMKELVRKGEVPALSLNQKHTVLLREDLLDFVRSKGREQAQERKRERPAKGQRTVAKRSVRGASRSALPDLSRYENIEPSAQNSLASGKIERQTC